MLNLGGTSNRREQSLSLISRESLALRWNCGAGLGGRRRWTYCLSPTSPPCLAPGAFAEVTDTERGDVTSFKLEKFSGSLRAGFGISFPILYL